MSRDGEITTLAPVIRIPSQTDHDLHTHTHTHTHTERERERERERHTHKPVYLVMIVTLSKVDSCFHVQFLTVYKVERMHQLQLVVFFIHNASFLFRCQ